MMANGGLVRVLIHTDVTKYLNFKAVDGGFVYNKKKVDIFVCTNRLITNLQSNLVHLELTSVMKLLIYIVAFRSIKFQQLMLKH